MSKKLKPTVAQAKAAWESHTDPSLNSVLAVLHAAGFTGMSKSTLQRWHATKWADLRPAGRPPSTPEAIATAKAATQKAADDEKAAENTEAGLIEAEVKALAEMALATLAETTAKESLIAQVMLARRIQRRAMELVQFAPNEAAKLIEALKKAPASNVTVVMPQKPDERGDPRTVGGNVIEHDVGRMPMTPLQNAIAEFRSQQQPMRVIR